MTDIEYNFGHCKIGRCNTIGSCIHSCENANLNIKGQWSGPMIWKLLEREGLSHPHFNVDFTKFKNYDDMIYDDNKKKEEYLTCNEEVEYTIGDYIISKECVSDDWNFQCQHYIRNKKKDSEYKRKRHLIRGDDIYKMLKKDGLTHAHFDFEKYIEDEDKPFQVGDFFIGKACLKSFPCQHYFENKKLNIKGLYCGDVIYTTLKKHNLSHSHFDLYSVGIGHAVPKNNKKNNKIIKELDKPTCALS